MTESLVDVPRDCIGPVDVVHLQLYPGHRLAEGEKFLRLMEPHVGEGRIILEHARIEQTGHPETLHLRHHAEGRNIPQR